MKRRDFLKSAIAASAVASLPALAKADKWEYWAPKDTNTTTITIDGIAPLDATILKDALHETIEQPQYSIWFDNDGQEVYVKNKGGWEQINENHTLGKLIKVDWLNK